MRSYLGLANLIFDKGYGEILKFKRFCLHGCLHLLSSADRDKRDLSLTNSSSTAPDRAADMPTRSWHQKMRDDFIVPGKDHERCRCFFQNGIESVEV